MTNPSKKTKFNLGSQTFFMYFDFYFLNASSIKIYAILLILVGGYEMTIDDHFLFSISFKRLFAII